jgi:hypothetical protein
LAQRWITYRRRSAIGDLFLGLYPATIAAPTSRRKGRVASGEESTSWSPRVPHPPTIGACFRAL